MTRGGTVSRGFVWAPKMAVFENGSGSTDNLLWKETKNALTELEQLLKCFICKRRLTEPLSIGTCNHHFCRFCIESENCSTCPECGLPAWRKDITADHQLSSVLDLVEQLNKHVSKETTQSSVTPQCGTPGVAGPCKSRRSVLAEGAEKRENGFRTPKITSEMIQQHILGRLGPLSMSNSSGTSQTSCEEKRTHTGRCDTFEECSEYKFHTRDIPTSKHIQSDTSRLESPVVVRKRRKGSLLAHSDKRRKTSETTFTGLQLPFTPILTKTRHFSQLSTHDKVSRLRGIFGDASDVVARSVRKNGKINHRSKDAENVPSTPIMVRTRHFAELNTSDRRVRLQHVFKDLQTRERESRLKAIIKKLPEKPKPSTGCDENVSSTVSHSQDGVSDAVRESVGDKSGKGPGRQVKRNVRGETPLHLACIKGDDEDTTALLEQGADPNVKDYAGWTPLHEACNHGFVKIVSVLLDHGALVNVPGYENETPLHDAVNNGHARIAQLLLARGADKELRNKYGLKASDYAHTDEMKMVFKESPSVSTNPVLPKKIKSPQISPLLRSRASSVVLLMSSLDELQRVGVTCTARKLNARVVNRFSPEVTHLVTSVSEEGCCPRTMKYFYAISYGVWVVSYEWILQSQRSGDWVDESQYEVLGASTAANTYATQAPQMSRENKALQNPALFDGCDFYFAGGTASPAPSKAELVELIQLLGGHTLSREPREDQSVVRKCPYHAEPNSIFTKVNTFVIFDPLCVDDRTLSKWKTLKSIAIASVAWLLDCITHFKLRPLLLNKT